MDGYTYTIKVDSNGNAVLPALANNADKADVSLRKAGTGSEKAFNKTGTSIGRARDEMGRFTSSSKSGFGTLQRSANRSNAALSKTRSLLAGIGLTLTAGAIATGIVSTGAGFEKSMSNVAALTQAAKSELVSLNQTAREAGATTAYSAKESADSMSYLAQAGYKTNQIIDALPATLSLAAAGSLELARSADIATNILSQYRMKAKDTGVVVDQLAFTQANFNTNIEEMSDAMNYFGPTAAA
ncbi:MAG: phage tail tape measure protein, partial [Methylococcales bacterium]